jgi:hypothetical protein
MTEAFEAARKVLEARLAVIEAEAQELRNALASFPIVAQARTSGRRRSVAAKARTEPSASSSSSSSSSRGRSKRNASRTSRRAKPGERQKQLLASIRRHPNRSVAEHADQIGIKPQQAYPLLKQLTSVGKLAKTDSGYRVKAG